jgi:signal transduction histidine kinase/CheY-like chemotaxis protein
MAILEFRGVRLPLYSPGTPLGLWVTPVLATVLATVPTAQVLRILKEALAASQRDVAERTRAENELRRHQERLEELVDLRTAELVHARDQAEAANRAKGAFLANMSHELRTPLGVILASSELLSESNPTPDQIEDIAAIGRSGEHLLGLISDVLDVAKIEAGKEELAIAASDLISTVRTVVAMMRGRAEEKHLALVYYQAPEVPRYVRVDAPKLRQILINLLGNAIKFTREGAIKLGLSAQPADDLGRARFCFDIEDSGVGIPKHHLGRIFEPFEQVRHPGPRMGTGLGLTITRRFVELMGGSLLAESEVDRGSRFVVELPLELATESEAYGLETAPEHPFILESGQPEWRVLIVDDDSESAAVLRKMLTRAGFQVRVAENGALGIEAFQQWQPHFIWMDLGMPQLSGTEATRRIRQLDGGAEVKIAAITASAYASERDGVIRAGFDDFAFKPFRQTEIFFCMARHLGVRYSSSEGAGNKAHAQAGGRPA